MTSMTEDSPRGDGSSPPPPYLAPTSPSMQPATSSLAPGVPSLPPDLLPRRVGNMVYKSGYLLLSSKGIGWTSWKKRWFILTSTSMVFLKTDPSAASKGNELNLTLGSIDLNSSGSVVIKEEKKLLTLVFPSGRDACSFNLKAETLEDLHEWKTALESALAEAPTSVVKNGSFKNEQTDVEHVCDDQPPKTLLNSGTMLLALEDSDGTPSFLEKALCFIEEFGVKVEGILRQAADVDDVERRIRDYEQGNRDFSPDEDPHVVSDCFKYVLREFPSSPLPASCCKALLEACRGDLSGRVDAIRTIICDTLPEPNQRLLRRILGMMETVASHKAVNRMSSSAVAACMAPLLLRPLLAGECELENDFDVGGDGSVQLLQAAAAANHAQAIVITLLEDYNNIFWEGSMSSGTYTDSLSESGDEDQSEGGSFEEEDDVKGDSDESCTGMADKRDKVIEVKEEIGRSSAELSRHDLNNLKVVCSIKDGELPVNRMATNKERTSTGVQEKLPVAETQCVEDDNINNNSRSMIVTGERVHERNVQLRVQRVALEEEVARLQEELERERRLRMKLEAALGPSHVGNDQ